MEHEKTESKPSDSANNERSGDRRLSTCSARQLAEALLAGREAAVLVDYDKGWQDVAGARYRQGWFSIGVRGYGYTESDSIDTFVCQCERLNVTLVGWFTRKQNVKVMAAPLAGATVETEVEP